MTITYTFKAGEEEKPANERIIEKMGQPVEFTMIALEHDDASFEKMLKELKGNRDIKKGIMDNVDTHHPSVKDIPEFDRVTIHMYQEAFAFVKQYDLKIKEIEEAYELHKAEKAEIKVQLPELAVTPVDEQANIEKEPDEKEKSGEEDSGEATKA